MKTFDVKNSETTLILYDKNGQTILHLENVFGYIDIDKNDVKINLHTDSNQISEKVKNKIFK